MIYMTNEQMISTAFKSLSDPTRRSLLMRLSQEGPCRVTDLADLYDMSLNAISKHIKVLERSELVKRRTIGRTHLIEADLTRIKLIEEWLSDLKSIWELRINKLAETLQLENEDE